MEQATTAAVAHHFEYMFLYGCTYVGWMPVYLQYTYIKMLVNKWKHLTRMHILCSTHCQFDMFTYVCLYVCMYSMKMFWFRCAHTNTLSCDYQFCLAIYLNKMYLCVHSRIHTFIRVFIYVYSTGRVKFDAKNNLPVWWKCWICLHVHKYIITCVYIYVHINLNMSVFSRLKIIWHIVFHNSETLNR